MAQIKFLNYTGLTNLVTDIIAWVTARIPTKTSELTNDSGYLTSHQDISGKVDKSGDTMTGQLIINRNNSAAGGGLKLTGDSQSHAISICDTSIIKGTAPSSQKWCGVAFYGNDSSNYNKRLGMVEFALSTANICSANLRAYNCTSATNTATCSISCYVDSSGKAYTAAPTPATSDNSTKIATTAFVKAQGYLTSHQSLSDYATKSYVDTSVSNLVNSAPETLDTLNELATALGNDANFSTTVTNLIGTKADDSSVVHTSGNETITGTKTFSSTITGNISGNAATASSVAWTNVSGRPTNVSSFTNDSGYLTTHQSLSNYVTLNGDQTISGNKTWSGEQTFSQTIQGNAATASAFDTAKSITLTGAVTGTVSGTNSWEIATTLKTGTASTGGTVSAPYFKIASWEVAPNKYFGAILQIQNKCYPHSTATLTLSIRTKTDATFQRGYSLLNNAIGILPSAFILCYKEVTGKVLCELYFYTTTSYNGIRFSVISEGIQNDNSLFNTMTVYQSPAGITALPSDYTVIQTSIGTYTQDFIPYSTNTYNLGTSSNQWQAVYANAYYLGTTAFGDIVTLNKYSRISKGNIEYSGSTAQRLVPTIGTLAFWNGAYSGTASNLTYCVKGAFGDIVTHSASEFLTSHQSLANYVTLDGAQTLTSTKTFTTSINTASTATTAREAWKLVFNKNSADTDSTAAAQIGLMQSANSHHFAALLRLANPRENNKPTTGNTGNCWSGIGVFYNYDVNKGYPYAVNCWDWPASSNSASELASTSWVRTYCETTKGFVTLNGNQTISGAKIFSKSMAVYNSDSTITSPPSLILRNSKSEVSLSGNTQSSQDIIFRDKNNTTYGVVRGSVGNGTTNITLKSSMKDSNNNTIESGVKINIYAEDNTITPITDNVIKLGTTVFRWSHFNGVRPDILCLPMGAGSGNYMDVSSLLDISIVNDEQTFTAPVSGWFEISFPFNKCTACKIWCENGIRAECTQPAFNTGAYGVYIPVIKDQIVHVRINATDIYAARIVYCNGKI